MATASAQPANRLELVERLVGKAHAIVRKHHAVAFLRGIQVHIGYDDEIVIARLVATQRRKRKAARSCGNIVNINEYRKRKERNA